MMRALALLPLLLAACNEPGPPARAVVELYYGADGKTRCVDGDDDRWTDRGCCPAGFSAAGYSVPTATAYDNADGATKRTLYRHVVCLQDPPGGPARPSHL